MIFGPDLSRLVVPFLETLPLAFLFCMLGFWAASWLIGEPRKILQHALAVILQWVLVIPLQLILGYQLNIWNPEASEATWIGLLASAIPIAGILAAYLILRHRLRHCLTVGIIASVMGVTTSAATFWALLKLNA